MALDWLDNRRRAMLREIGIRVWQAPASLRPAEAVSASVSATVSPEAAAQLAELAPEAPASTSISTSTRAGAGADARSAPELIAARAGKSRLAGTFDAQKTALEAFAGTENLAPAAPAAPAAPPSANRWTLELLPPQRADLQDQQHQHQQQQDQKQPDQQLQGLQPANPVSPVTPAMFPAHSPAPRWLVVCETGLRLSNRQADVSGQLLHNMLRAMQQTLPRLSALSAETSMISSTAQSVKAANEGPQPVVQLASWSELKNPQNQQSQLTPQQLQQPAQQLNQSANPPKQESATLCLPVAQAIAHFQPDVVLLLMGRTAAIAWLSEAQNPPADNGSSSESSNSNAEASASLASMPFNQLRSQPHAINGIGNTITTTNAIVSYDLQSLLRTPQRKAQAWEDICQAVLLGQQAAKKRWANALLLQNR